MKNKLIWLLGIALCSFALIVCSVFLLRNKIPQNKENNETHNKSTLYINGKLIESDFVEICVNKSVDMDYRYYAVLPLIEVLESFGMDVVWLNDDNAIISSSDAQLTLSLSEKTLIDNRIGDNWLRPVPGIVNYYCKVENKNIIVDDNTLHVILTELGIKVEIDINRVQNKIDIAYRE